MDARERLDDPEETVRSALDARLAGLWTALPGIVQSFDAATQTVSVQPAIQAARILTDGTRETVTLPLLVDVPVVFPGGGGLVLTMPVAAGDEALVVFSARCIDAWWQSGGVQPAMEARLHDLSDGFALIGPRAKANALSGVSTTAAQWRTVDGASFVELTAAGALRFEAETIALHARTSWSWDVNGYGQRITALGGTAYTIETWQKGATVTTTATSVNPPEGP